MSLLQAKGISYHYEKQLFSNLDLEGKRGEIISIMGVSGSGKSTLLHILSSFLKPQSGSVSLLGEDLYSLSSSKLLELRRKEIGIIFQSHYLFLGFSVLENLEVASLLSGEAVDKEILSIFGILDTLDKNIGSLSGGQQQRVSIARILTKKPKIIFADEPTGNLDKDTTISVMQLLFDYTRLTESLLIFVTHDPILASKADKSYLLDNALLKSM